jgi:SAM-dependent methyltransferase
MDYVYARQQDPVRIELGGTLRVRDRREYLKASGHYSRWRSAQTNEHAGAPLNAAKLAEISQTEGRRAFGSDPAAYHEARPGYPERVFDILRNRCEIGPGSRVFEVGAGTGIASQRLFHLGADPLVLVEPDQRLAKFLSETLSGNSPTIKLIVTSFEQAELQCEWFDAGTSASAFHWLDEVGSLRKIARTLRPGGWWSMWWNLFFGAPRCDEFYKATRNLLTGLRTSPSSGLTGRPPFALDTEMRIANLRAAGKFENIDFETISWTMLFDTTRTMKLYRTFSPISRLDAEDQEKLLGDLGEIAERQFGGKVDICITTAIYTAKRAGEAKARHTSVSDIVQFR